jgi:antitoxin component of RelBE/YafQ-DinJ toxin-antitoxin module
MTTITIIPRNKSTLPFLKKLLSNPDWVKEIEINEEKEKKPNSETIKAIKEARMGKGVQCKDLDDFFKKLNE